MTVKTTLLKGPGYETLLAELRRDLGERMTKLFMTPVVAEAAETAGPDSMAEPIAAGRGVLVTGGVAAEDASARFAAFFDEPTALSLAGAVRGIAPEKDEDTIAAFSAIAGELGEAITAGARTQAGPSAAAKVEDVRWVPRIPAPIGERARIRLSMGGTQGTLALDLVEDEPSPNLSRPSDVLLELELPFALRLASVQLELGQIQQLDQGAVIPLARAADGDVSLVVGGRVVARGTLVVVDGCFGIQIESVETAERRLSSLGRL